MKKLVVIIGVGGMGLACARRIGSGARLILADFNVQGLESTASSLRDDGYEVVTQGVDVADPASVAALADTARAAGPLASLVHTAGLSPTMATAARIYSVDLLGTALVLDAFLPLAQPGTVAVMIASMASHFIVTPLELETRLATAPTVQLLDVVAALHPDDPYGAYGVSKRGNQLRVEAVAPAWGARGARVVSISPGLIHTGMARQEEAANPQITALRQAVPMQRYGTADDIAGAVEWLVGPNASYISGVDLRIDGGVVGAVRWSATAQ